MSINSKYITLFLIATLFGFVGYSQDYQPFPSENALWREMTGGYQSSNCTDYHIIITGDTIVNGYTYSKLRKIGVKYAEDQWGWCTSQIIWTFNNYTGAIRNDSVNRKVYFLQPDTNEDTLFYDFNLSAGQVLPATYIYFNGWGGVNVVSSIDSILIEEKYHKRYFISDTIYGYIDYVELIEGIGSTFGLFGPLTPQFESGSTLLCFKRNGYTVYPYFGYPCNLVTSIDDNEGNGKVIQAYPNPFSTSTTIEYQLEKISSIQFTIYSVQGVVVFDAEERLLQAGIHTVTWSPPPHIPAGLYYAVLRSEEGVSVVKMVKQ